ncbi:protein of unknown function DUF820 [Rippkaea orientalis PCC 8801]|uniref:Putative restriction endonuclease domain-containing protein n=1 Tax=Rippkaea orientalis (strain PCC 8801 / RF-1) TaxID=41431 RepID=B7JZF2_RIPO1|nr:Uma2 family endonuclease [Rippkaea orientalis]ACK67363.1 protein of unknown function DUF820 [Rippkaea orientalis PCC 8801]
MIAQLEDNKIYSPEEYLEFEVNSLERHEYINGEIIAMTGGTPNHNKIALNFSSLLNFGLKKQPYDIFMSDQRLWIPEKCIYTYPDVMVISQPLEYQETRKDTLINPLLIGEVLSKSTKNYDKDEKFAAYRTIPTFKEYILIDQYSMHVEHYAKIEINQWIFREYNIPETSISFNYIPLQIELADLYDKVDL